MTVTLMQTSDAIFYYPMLLETAKTVRALCARNGFAYEQYVGIKRGHMPWQASYNRVYMLKEMIDRGVEGWVLYMDADAFIQDLDFDLGTYLSKRSGSAAIFAGYCTCDTAYDINSGGFAINLSHPIGKGLILDWYDSVANVSSDIFDGAVHWQHDLANDQHLLWQVLKRYVEDISLGDTLIFERSNQSYVNNGPFIAQFLRSSFSSQSDRVAALTARVAEIMRDQQGAYEEEKTGIYLRAQHPKLVTGCGRKTSLGIQSVGDAGGLLFGPYIYLPAGTYEARIIGEIRLPDGQDAIGFHSDVATDRGFKLLAQHDRHVDRATNGVISSLQFDLEEDTDSLEVRLTVGPGADISIYAVHIVPE